MQGYIEKRALKKELSKEDVEALCKELMEVGIVEMGRYLAVCEIFKSNPWEDCLLVAISARFRWREIARF